MAHIIDGCTVEIGKSIKSRWGQWYRHDRVLHNGTEIGQIQVRRRYYGRRFKHRIEVITLRDNTCVIGRDIEWLKREAASN